VKEISIRAEVECTDGPAGQSTNLIVDPKTLKVSHYAVKEKRSPHTERLVPVEQVAESTPELLRLSCTIEELSALPAFRFLETQQASIPSYTGVAAVQTGREIRTLQVERTHVPQGELALTADAKVEATDGEVGHVDALLTDEETGQITHLVMREGHAWGAKEVVLPISIVDDVEGDTVYLTVDKATIAGLLAIPAKLRGRVTEIELVVLTCDEEAGAKAALSGLKSATKAEDLGILNAAVLVKDSEGKTSIKEAGDVEGKHGALLGGIAGGLVGLLGGPVGAVVGAIGGAIAGGAAGKWLDLGFSEEYLTRLEEEMRSGSSALVLLVEVESVGKVVDALAEFEGQAMNHALTDEMISQLAPEEPDVEPKC
jgi:uncharacterized membrane protein